MRWGCMLDLVAASAVCGRACWCHGSCPRVRFCGRSLQGARRSTSLPAEFQFATQRPPIQLPLPSSQLLRGSFIVPLLLHVHMWVLKSHRLCCRVLPYYMRAHGAALIRCATNHGPAWSESGQFFYPCTSLNRPLKSPPRPTHSPKQLRLDPDNNT